MSLITKELYHGTDLKLNILKPTAYNAGHRLKKDSWSVFMWPTYKLAYKWAIFVAIKHIVRGHKHIVRPIGYHERVGFNDYEFYMFMNGKYEEEIKKLCVGKKAYVYIIDCPIDLKFNVGNNNAQPEYTYDGELKIKKRIEFTITEKVIDENINMMPEEECVNFRAKDKCVNIRGPLGYIFYSLDDVIDKWGYVYMRMDLNEIKPGDDLEEIMKKYSEKEREAVKKRFKKKYELNEGSNMKMNNKRFIAPKVKNFREFCEKIKNPEEALEWFIQNKVKWTKNGNDNPFQWPDDLIRDKMGNCFDQTLFMHYFCRSKRIDNKMFLITWLGDNNKATGHAVPVYKKGSYCFVWLYLKPGAGMIGGPFRNYNEVKDVLDRYFTISVNKIIKTPTTSISSYLDDDDLAIFDEYYGRRDLTQAEYIQMGFGKNMRSSHLYKIWLYKGRFQLPNPALYMYDILSGVGKLFKGEELD